MIDRSFPVPQQGSNSLPYALQGEVLTIELKVRFLSRFCANYNFFQTWNGKPQIPNFVGYSVSIIIR